LLTNVRKNGTEALKVYTAHSALDLIATAREEVYERGEPVVMATVVRAVGSNPQQVGARMLRFLNGEIMGTVGGGRIEARILEESDALLSSEDSQKYCSYNLQKDLGMTCGGVMDVFLEKILPAPHVVIFGGGHVSAPTAELAVKSGFRVTVVEPREDWGTHERFPNVHELSNLSFDDFLADFTPQSHHFLVLVSKGHSTDLGVLQKVIHGPQTFTGMIGSKQKAWSVWKKLREAGISEELWNKVVCPIGLPIGGQHPSEIAVSIVAQLIQVRYEDIK